MGNYFNRGELDCNCPNHEYNFSQKLLDILNIVREKFGRPIYINSACRCVAYNKAVGGVDGSAHLCSDTEEGEAADIRCDNSKNRFTLLNLFLNYGIRRMKIYDTFIHVDVDKDKPQNILDVD